MKNINKKTIWIVLITLVIGLFLGKLIFGGNDSNQAKNSKENPEGTIWTCSMHPQIRQPEPGKCPICGMDLIPLSEENHSEENPMEIKMSPTAMQLANVQTAVISMKKPVKEIRLNGKIKADERKIISQSSHIPGRIEKLLVSFTGESVQQGQVLAYVYSPELVTAQEELFEAFKIKETQPNLFEAAKEKLKNWKLTEKQINEILERKVVIEEFPILADVSGIVTNKKVNLGDYIKKGQSIYEIANLNSIWVLFDIYESDIPWVKLNDKIQFTVQSLPGENFNGKISFIDPVINAKTRVASARLEMNNPGMRLKPDMFVIGKIESPLNNEAEALVVPKSAVMWTGERSVVYVKSKNENGINFMMREVTLGLSLGDSYVIQSGLESGEEIAINGTFSIDAASQLAGKPSMMNPEGGITMTGHNHGGSNPTTTSNHNKMNTKISISSKAKNELKPLYENYFQLKDALANDDAKKAINSIKELDKTLSKINMGVFTGEAHNHWMKHSSALEKEINKAKNETEIKNIRKQFIQISNQIIMLTKSFGAIDEMIYLDYCPMANDNKGAEWLSKEKKIKNPYFGKSMLKCGEVKDKFQTK